MGNIIIKVILLPVSYNVGIGKVKCFLFLISFSYAEIWELQVTKPKKKIKAISHIFSNIRSDTSIRYWNSKIF